MKIWALLPQEFLTKPPTGFRGFHGISTSATVPALSKECQEDHLAWFEVDIIRKMEQQKVFDSDWMY